jgi:hypothetical protein
MGILYNVRRRISTGSFDLRKEDFGFMLEKKLSMSKEARVRIRERGGVAPVLWADVEAVRAATIGRGVQR